MSELGRDLTAAVKELGGVVPPAAATAELARRAEAERLLDVGYAHLDSPLGRLTLAATPRGLVRVAYSDGDLEQILGGLAREISPRVLEAPGRMDPIRRELEEYFEGSRRQFSFAVDLSLSRGFFRQVLEATARIGFGEVRSYAEVAAEAGSPRAVRATGNGLGSNPIPIVVPCHRVVRTGGEMGGYTGGVERKKFLLSLEGR